MLHRKPTRGAYPVADIGDEGVTVDGSHNEKGGRLVDRGVGETRQLRFLHRGQFPSTSPRPRYLEGVKLHGNTAEMATTLVTIIALVGITGCSATARPDPTSAPATLVFETEEEAYAAAEGVYRAYLDGYNEVEYSDPDAYSKIEQFVTAHYADAEQTGISTGRADGITKVGEFIPVWFRGVEYSENGDVVAVACDDISNAARFNADGTSRVHPDRSDALSRTITFTPVGQQLRIADAVLKEDPDCVL